MFKNLNVGVRLVGGFAIVLALMVLVSAISLSRLSAIKSDLEAVTGEAPERLANAMRDLARAQGTALRDALMQDDVAYKKKEFDRMKKDRAEYDRTLATLSAMPIEPEVKAALEKTAVMLEALKAPMAKAIDRSMGDDMAGAAQVMREEVRPAQAAHIEALEHVVESIQRASKIRDEQANASYHRAVTMIVGLSVAGLLAGVVVAWLIQKSIAHPLTQAVEVVQAVAEGDLSRQIRVESHDEVGRLLKALVTVNRDLGRTMQNIRQAAEAVEIASTEIAAGNADLSRRTEQQASSLQQTAASMEQLNATVKNNADTARSAAQMASSASAAATKGGAVVAEVVSTMQAISDSSKKISDIIGTIDGIAFQTNILALNAAVEAARAGEQGRGFAVVASEVRALAQRSAQAAKEIKTLIGASVASVETGARLVGDAGSTMSDIVLQVQRVTDLIDEISSATTEQTSGIGQVNQAVSQLDQVTQQNSALVEQSAAAADSLKQQAGKMVDAVRIFRIASTSEVCA